MVKIWAYLCMLIIKKDILIPGNGSIQGLDDTTLAAEAKLSVNFRELRNKVCLSLHYNGVNSYLFDNLKFQNL